jgi:hypothetical protein
MGRFSMKGRKAAGNIRVVLAEKSINSVRIIYNEAAA